MRIRLLNTVLLASDFEKLLSWYKQTFELQIGHSVSGEYHYAELNKDSNFVIAIADAKEMGANPDAVKNNTAIPQLAVSDVSAGLESAANNGGKVLFGPSYDEKGKFYYGGFKDIEDNQIWIVEDK
jgi:predicted enzyme related to lactoylglutathione lyase